MAIIKVHAVDRSRYKTIGPIYWDVPGAAATDGVLLANGWISRGFLRDFFETHPETKPSDYDEYDSDDETLVCQELKREENTPRDGIGRYTVMFGYVPKPKTTAT